jgi:hypothetical protein
MGRIRIIGAGKLSTLFLKNIEAVNFAQGGLGNQHDVPLLQNESSLSSKESFDFRSKVKSNASKKRFLIKRHQEKIQIKSERIRNLRKTKLERYRIDFIPLCSDEDWENMSEFYSKNPEKNT